jgi:hypothetical protein
MSYLRNHKLLLVVIGVLLLANVWLLWNFVWDKKSSHRQGPPGESARTRLIKEIGFNDEQTAVYDSLRKQHYDGIGPMFGELRSTRDSLFKLVHQTEINDSVIAALSASVSQQQQAIDLKIHRYFRSLRELCKDDQKVKLDSFLVKMSRQMPWGGRRGPGGPSRSKK